MRKWIPIFFGFSILLISCSLSMSEQEKVQNILSAPAIDTNLSDPFVETGHWPAKVWWAQYESKELNSLIEKSLEKNPTIQAVRERIELAKSQSTIAHSELLPLVYFNMDDQWQYLSQNGLYRALNPQFALSSSQIDFSLSFSYEFDFWGKYRNLYRAALGREKAAIAEQAQVELITSASLAQMYFALKTNLVRKKLYKQLYEVRKNYFNLQAKMLKNSLYSQLTPLLSEEHVFQAQQYLDQIEQEIAVNKHVVNILAGQGPEEFLALDESLSPLSSKLAIPQNISMELLIRRPDLMAQMWRVDALAYEVGAAKADFWPNINIVGLMGFQSGSWSNLFEWVSKTIGVLPALNLPVYTAGKIGAQLDAKRALFNEAVYHYNELILKGFQEVADLLAMGRSVYGEKEKQMQIVSNSFSRYRLTKLRQKNGIDSALVGYQFLEEWIQKQLEDVELLYQQYLVSIALIKSLGGGYIECAPEDLNG